MAESETNLTNLTRVPTCAHAVNASDERHCRACLSMPHFHALQSHGRNSVMIQINHMSEYGIFWECKMPNKKADLRFATVGLIALEPCPPLVVGHPFEGLVTWKQKQNADGRLCPAFKYNAIGVWDRVTRGKPAATREMCKRYTPEHIHAVVDWHKHHSVQVQPGQTAADLKSAFREKLGA